MRRVCLIFALASFASYSGQIFAQQNASSKSAPQADSGPAPKNSPSPTNSASPVMRFRDVSAEAGVTTIPHTRTDRRYVLDTMSAGGVALLDCDNDGKLDLAVIN